MAVLALLALAGIATVAVAIDRCPPGSPTGWPYVPINISATADSINTTFPSPIPPAVIATCYDTQFPQTNEPVHVLYTFKTDVPPEKLAIAQEMIRKRQEMSAELPASSEIPNCPKGGWGDYMLRPGTICTDYPPWCSTEVWIDFQITLTAGKHTKVIKICCSQSCD
eukprot:m.242276 g.242276  ORF g.242276 m.242276 type:complete len:167 (+) comp14001_c0_seq1:16-516(+)